MHDIMVSMSVMSEGLLHQVVVFHDQAVIVAFGVGPLNETVWYSSLLCLMVFRLCVKLGVSVCIGSSVQYVPVSRPVFRNIVSCSAQLPY